MFSKISSLLAQAAEVTSQVLSGPTSRHDEFEYKWKEVTRLLMSEYELAQCAPRVEPLLSDMVQLLSEEEEEKESMGPCLEFLIRHKLLDTLYTISKSDYPPGMRKVVLNFFALLLGRLHHFILPHITVHQPVNRLIGTCGLTSSNPLAVDEVQFLRALSLALHHHHTLAAFFVETGEGGDKFTVLEALMRITNSEDSVVCLKAFECLLQCTSLTNTVTTPIIASSQLPILLASKLRHHFQLMSPSLTLTQVLSCNGGWGGSHTSLSSPQQFHHVELFLSWLDYCEQVTSSSPQVVSDAVCAAISDLVCQSALLPKLTSNCEGEFILSVSVLTRCLYFLSHQRLREEFFTFLFSDVVWPAVIQCCNHINDEVCLASLTMLHALLSIPNCSLLSRLLPLSSWQQKYQHTPPVHRNRLEQTVKSYLSIPLPSLLSAGEMTEGSSGMMMYLMEAHVQIAECHTTTTTTTSSCSPLSTDSVNNTHSPPPASPPPASPPPASPPSDDTHKEDILSAALMNRLERLLDQPYELNLVLTSVIARLACFTHPMIDDYLYSSIAGHLYPRTFYTILRKVSNKLQSHASRSPGLQVNIVEARRRLLGEQTSDLLSMPNNELLEGAIVLEEFCKELGAILYTKHSQELLTLASQ